MPTLPQLTVCLVIIVSLATAIPTPSSATNSEIGYFQPSSSSSSSLQNGNTMTLVSPQQPTRFQLTNISQECLQYLPKTYIRNNTKNIYEINHEIFIPQIEYGIRTRMKIYAAVGENEIVTGDYFCEAANSDFLMTLFDETLITNVRAQVDDVYKTALLNNVDPNANSNNNNNNNHNNSNNNNGDDSNTANEHDDEDEDEDDFDDEDVETREIVSYFLDPPSKISTHSDSIENNSLEFINNNNRNHHTNKSNDILKDRSKRMIPVYDQANLAFYVDEFNNTYNVVPNGLVKVITMTTITLDEAATTPHSNIHRTVLDNQPLMAESDTMVRHTAASESFNKAGFAVIKTISDKLSKAYWGMSMQKSKDASATSESFLTYVGTRVNRMPEMFVQMDQTHKLLVNLLILDIMNDDPKVNWFYNFNTRIRRITRRPMILTKIGRFSTDMPRQQWRELDATLIALTNEAIEHRRAIELNLQDLVTPLMSLIVTQKNNADIADCSKLKTSQKVYMCFAKNMHLFEDKPSYALATALFSEFSVAHHQLEVDKIIARKLLNAHNEFLTTTERFIDNRGYKQLHQYVVRHYNIKNITLSSFDIYKF